MKKLFFLIFFLSFITVCLDAQEQTTTIKGYVVPAYIYEGDTIALYQMPTLHVFKPLVFKNKKEQKKYNRLVINVKKTLPIAKEVNQLIIETYEYLLTLPDEKARNKHIRIVEKELKQQYTPRLKKLTFSQGKLLIKLIDRETASSSYELVKAFLGPFKAGFYQAFASIFGASLKKEYHPEDEDAMIERIVLLVESGQL